MVKTRWFLHPIFIFIFSLVALLVSLFLYIHWSLTVDNRIHKFISSYNIRPESVYNSQTWVEILTLSILVGIIITGLAIIFFYYNKSIQLFRQQQNFISGFTHELKTPIASLQLYLETFCKYDIPRGEQLKYLGFMRNDTKRLSSNVDRILNLGLLEDKKIRRSFEDVELVGLIESLLSENSHLFKDSKISINNPSGKRVFYPIDPSSFEILITNLLINGVNHNNSTTPEIFISIGANSKFLNLEFKDNGIGVSKKEIKNLFKKFFRGKGAAKGTGLGLYLVQTIAKIHGGVVEAQSEGLSKGSTFSLQLPVKGAIFKDGLNGKA